MVQDEKILEKEKYIKEDGRYIFFYKFKDESGKVAESKDKKVCRK